MILQIIISNGILDLVTGILAKISLGTGIWAKFRLGTGIWYPPSQPSPRSSPLGTFSQASDSYDRIALNNTNSLLQIRNAFWVSGRGGGGAETRYKMYSCKGPCKGKSYETICENIVSQYQTLVSSLPRGTVFLHRRPKTEFITGQP